MTVHVLKLEEMCAVVDEKHNPPHVTDQREENRFQAEIRELYNQLIDALSPFGEEGDIYGVSDFAVRPDLKERPRILVRAPHTRQFALTIISAKCLGSDYLSVLRTFL